jgi:hypothetical protein
MFDYKLLTHVTNIIAEIIYEIKLVRTPISLQQISIVPAKKKFGETGRHASVHQTVVGLIKTMMMEDDDAMQFIYVQDQVKNRRLAYGETISPCTCLTGIGITPLTMRIPKIGKVHHFMERVAVSTCQARCVPACSRFRVQRSRDQVAGGHGAAASGEDAHCNPRRIGEEAVETRMGSSITFLLAVELSDFTSQTLRSH